MKDFRKVIMEVVSKYNGINDVDITNEIFENYEVGFTEFKKCLNDLKALVKEGKIYKESVPVKVHTLFGDSIMTEIVYKVSK